MDTASGNAQEQDDAAGVKARQDQLDAAIVTTGAAIAVNAAAVVAAALLLKMAGMTGGAMHLAAAVIVGVTGGDWFMKRDSVTPARLLRAFLVRSAVILVLLYPAYLLLGILGTGIRD